MTAAAQDFAGFPASGSPATANSEIMVYDLSKTPDFRVRNELLDCVDIKPSSCNWQCNNCFREESVDIRFCSEERSWGLTYDDGPSENTPGLLNLLAKQGIKATFFVTGSNTVRFPEIVKRIFDEGHQVAVHTWSHPPLTTISNENIVAELEWTIRAIEKVIGTRPLFYRPPYGDIDDRVRTISQTMGLRTTHWEFNSTDWTLTSSSSAFTAEELKSRIRDKVAETSGRGLIDLSHDLNKESIDMAPNTISEVIRLGFVPMTVSECLGGAQAYSDSTIKVQHSMSNSVGRSHSDHNSSNGNDGAKLCVLICLAICLIQVI